MFKYLVAFSLYTLAMVGILLIACVIYKKATNFNSSKKDGGMRIEDALRLSNRKMLYIVNVRGERFLIASDAERTTFLAKLEGKEGIKVEHINRAMDDIAPKKPELTPYTPVSKELRENNERKQIEEYIKELEALDIIDKTIEEDEYSNAIDINSKNVVLKNILKELRESKKGKS